jgi:hypothetical protein
MATTADDRLTAQVVQELAGPEPAVHFGVTLLVATLVSSPVLTAAALGNRSVPAALALYLVALVVAWFVVGLIGGAFAMVGRRSQEIPDDGADGDASPSAHSDSVGSNGAH